MIRIERAAVPDSVNITRLFEALIAEITERTGAPTPLFSLSGTAEKCKSYLETGIYTVWMATDRLSGRAVGFLSLCESHALYADGAFGIIQEFYVEPEYRSRGVGARLLAAAQAYGKTCGWKRLEVVTPPLPFFQRTVLFYERNGFEKTGGAKLKAVLL
ncbi:GNAT family N-acetyltransferase [Paenibacillus allorhizosphaerae]|uniref:N-acetyltransferase domain-containing protein n=1 Tax=Paenibacillus allorhizosphaerae TaxID=2849866 RepID=A0ABM8VFR5_9BACL|nr:GNAT family N-acetyltransferase [Paenibacillus allorhizosphaerae]CAG7635800.1 hypothetical protein PAECIP111802_02181 [Paenibacillus allorhizosphaerae]